MTERTAEEWGRLAVSLPGWRWMPGMRDGDDSSRCVRVEFRHGAAYDAIFWDGEDEGVVESDQPASAWPDPDDPATTTEGGGDSEPFAEATSARAETCTSWAASAFAFSTTAEQSS